MIRTISRTTANRALAATGLLVSGAVLLTGCSSSSPSSASPAASSSPSAAASGAASQFTAYRQCLSQHGVTMPTGRPSGHFSGRPSGRPSGSHSGGYGGGGYGGGFGFGGGASANPTEAAAAKACASLAPKGGFGGGGAGGSTALVAFTGCMKDHGVTVTGGTRGMNTTDPKTAAALAICKALLPTRGTHSPAASTTPSA